MTRMKKAADQALRAPQQQAAAGAAAPFGVHAQLAAPSARALQKTEPGMPSQARTSSARDIASSPRLHAQRLQLRAFTAAQPGSASTVTGGDHSGLPADLKQGIEALSGMAMDRVKVHYNSAQPAQLNAHAFARGSDIHLGPGQEQHLPHEAWHVVQQAQGRVPATVQTQAGVPLNDDASLEQEADVMGAKAMQASAQTSAGPQGIRSMRAPAQPPVQRVLIFGAHLESGPEPWTLAAAEDFPGFAGLSEAQQRELHRLVTDPESHDFDSPASLLETLQDHPLAPDLQPLSAQVLDWLREVNPLATVGELLDDSHESKAVWARYREMHRERGEANEIMLRSILGGYETHRTGMSGSMVRPSLVTDRVAAERGGRAFNEAYGPETLELLLKQYKLSPTEAKALQAYTSPNKKERDNPHYMGGDRDPQDWAPFTNGWAALESAMSKIPSLGELGVELTTYRIPRAPTNERDTDEPAIYRNMRPGTHIAHGHEAMPDGQHHYMSTALTYSVHFSGAERGGAVGITGRSGRYINPFGVMSGSVDGGEILYPPHVNTSYEGSNPFGVSTKSGPRPVYHFREVPAPQVGEDSVEDNRFRQIRHPSGLPDSHHRLLRVLDTLPGDVLELFHAARDGSGIDGPIMYLSTAELLRLNDAFRLAMLDALEQAGSEQVFNARFHLNEQGDLAYLPLERLIRLCNSVLSN